MSSVQTRTEILDEDGIKRKIRRMALEVAEQNEGENNIILAGIVGNGTVVAKCIAQELKKMNNVSAEVISIELNKKEPV